MKKFISYSLLVILPLMVWSSCKTTQQKVKAPESFKIEFYSRGEGIDNLAVSRLQQLLATYLNKKITIEYTTEHWGREGEITYSFTRGKVSKKNFDKFYFEVKELLKDSMIHLRLPPETKD